MSLNAVVTHFLLPAALSCQVILAGLAVLAFSRRTCGVVYAGSALVAALGTAVAVAFLLQGGVETLALPFGLPWIGMHFRLDALAAVFLAVVQLGGAAASLFAIGYSRHEDAPERVAPFVPVFIAAMSLVTLSDDVFSFLLAWESMSVLSWALVISQDRTPEHLRAGLIYMIMAAIGTFALVIAFALLAGGDFRFAAIRNHGIGGGTAGVVLGLVLIGAGSKAGLFPLHAWLPLAHPAAPSPVSALMSGVMTKVAVYGFVRIVFDLMGPLDWGFAVAVIAVGAATALLGILYALMQNDLKRLLAYSTVENIGIIFTALGMALAFRAVHLPAAAALAATAALFHVVNHALFKSLLFFGAGVVQHAAGSRDIDRLGGLIHTMPRTALVFLIGAAAIAALPPLNGFASEWLVFQAAFLAGAAPQWGLRLMIPTAAATLALSAALAAACFVKAFGVSFLGRARSDAAKAARDPDLLSRIAMFALAAGCIGAGLLPQSVTNLLGPAAAYLTTERLPWAALHQPLLPVAASHNTYSGLAIGLAAITAIGLVALAVHLVANRRTRRSDTWDCGHPEANRFSQYSAGSFAQPIRRVYAAVAFGARETVAMPPPGETGPARFAVRLPDPAWTLLYAPTAKLVGRLADRLNPFQYLTIRIYLGIVFGTLVALLTGLAIWL
jgi:formate hydrogenlyase subunit 3/multisubunit Na+/H+ antiporter MnhD subunit